MFQKTKSSTMRIDLIPEISEVPLSAHPKQVVVSSRKPRQAAVPASAAPAARQAHQELFQSIYDGGFITDLRGRVREVNRRAVEFFGHDPESFRQLHVRDLVAGASEELVRTLAENLQNERFTLMQAYCIRRDETIFPTEIAVSLLRLAVPHLCFFVRDVTLRRQAEEMLRTEHNAIQNASDAILVTDLEARLEYVNPATARIWGYASPADLVGSSLGVLLENAADAHRIIGSLTGETFQWKGVVSAVRADGERFRAHASAACNRDSDGDVTGVVLSFSDLSAVERMETAARDLERQRAVLEAVRQEADSLAEWVREIANADPGSLSEVWRERQRRGEAAVKRLQNVLGSGT